jgi:hypothetical protein
VQNSEATSLFGKTADVINYDFEGMAPGSIQTTGDAAPGDGNASIYTNHGTSNPNVSGSIKSADGIWWMFISKVGGGAGGGGGGTPSTTPPLMDSVANPGTVVQYSRGDHVHPSDTSRLALAGEAIIGPLVLYADPSANLEAATRQYVDSVTAGKVNRSGDTMTYTLKITNPNFSGTSDANAHAAEFILDKPDNTLSSGNALWGFTTGLPRWCMMLGNYTGETGLNVGSDFELKRYDDARAYLDSPFYIDRRYGYTTISCLTVGPESTNGFLVLNKTTGGTSTIRESNSTVPRWSIDLGDNTPEIGSNSGSDFGITRFADDGIPMEKVLQISRTNGDITINHDPTQPMGVATKQYVDSGGAGGWITEAPTDGQTYGRDGLNAAWNAVLPFTGGTVRGKITVYGVIESNEHQDAGFAWSDRALPDPW